MSKYITIDCCHECPILGYEEDEWFCHANDYKIILNPDEVDVDCPLEDYPETVTEFLGGKI